MVSTFFSKGLLAAAAVCLFQTTALAGGFARGDADTDILYDPGTVNFRGGVLYVSPQRGYETINGATATDGDYTKSYFVPTFAAKFTAADTFSCALTYTQPFGAESEYGSQTQAADALTSGIGNYTISAKFKTEEYGATCSVKLDVGPGDLHFLGGAFIQSFDYEEKTRVGTLNLKDDGQVGYRIGAAYEITEYALRAELLYRSKIDHEADGGLTLTPYGAAVASGALGFAVPTGTVLSSNGAGTLPQSLELNLQSGIAPGWLAFGSVKWTDWSVLQSLNYTVTGLGPQQKNFRFKDGWTLTGGIGHAFTDKISGLASITWDRGVGTGADIMTDTWTFGLGASFKGGPGELRVGGAVSYLTSGSQKLATGYGDYNATVGDDWAYALTASYRINF